MFKFSDLIWTKENALPLEFCNNVIDKFENDKHKVQGTVLEHNTIIVDNSVKSSTDLYISHLSDDWQEEDKVFHHSLSQSIPQYKNYCASINQRLCPHRYSNLSDSGYQIQRTYPGEYYHWHHDFDYDVQLGFRIMTFIWYLNSIELGNDGYTEFIDGTRIQPEAGKLLIFPSLWSYVHRGVSPQNQTKYICTGWIYDRLIEV